MTEEWAKSPVIAVAVEILVKITDSLIDLDMKDWKHG